MLRCVLGVFIFFAWPAMAQDLTTLEAQRADVDRAYRAQQDELSVAQEQLSHLQGEIVKASETHAAHQRQLDVAKEQLLQQVDLFFRSTTVTFDAEREAYKAAKQAVADSEQNLAQQRIRVAEALEDIEKRKASLRPLQDERRRLQLAITEARFEKLRQQIERQQVVEARGEYSCGQLSIHACKQQAMAQAQRHAAEQGAAVLVQSATDVDNFVLTRDQIRTAVEALILRHEILQEDFVGNSGYAYTIRATVQGQISPELRKNFFGAGTDRDETRPQVRHLLQQAIGFYTGSAGKVDLAQARSLFSQAADSQDALATLWLARCYAQGLAGFEKNAVLGRQLAMQAIQEVKHLAYADDPEASFLLGVALHEGFATEQDVTQAVSWYQKAAEQGHLIAQNTLGAMYLRGDGVPQNIAKAVDWFRKAAAQGDVTAQYNIGLMYEHGMGIDPNSQAALLWYRKAAERGHAEAQKRVQRLTE